MTLNLRTLALAALAAFASMTPALYAQNTLRTQVDVPFSFDYGTTHFGRGTYIISMNEDDSLTVWNRATNQAAMAIARVEYSPVVAQASQVVFRKYGDRWFLEALTVAGNENSVFVQESKAEKRAARELASRGGEETQVALALLPETAFGK
ncbi:MAG TPA: hypothetical protein VHU89_02350 [Acidobacteriaceae bacterium]|jgi:hypothetical protein|nr:hypothetical protein [Acidobacteriaceae bacterium]